MSTSYKRIKVLIGYSAQARFLANLSEFPAGYIASPRDIPSPYSHSPSRAVFAWGDRLVFIMETKHRRFEVYEVPKLQALFSDEVASEAYVRSMRPAGA